LTEDQKWALAIARIRKRPNFSKSISGLGTFVMSSALRELESRSSIGLVIRDLELYWLDQFRKDQIERFISIIC